MPGSGGSTGRGQETESQQHSRSSTDRGVTAIRHTQNARPARSRVSMKASEAQPAVAVYQPRRPNCLTGLPQGYHRPCGGVGGHCDQQRGERPRQERAGDLVGDFLAEQGSDDCGESDRDDH